MLTAQQIKDKLTVDDVKKLISLLGGELYDETNEELIYDTICHSGHSNKLYFYTESKNLHCYTECGNLDIFQLIMNVKDYSFPEALNWVTTQMGYSTLQYGFGNFEVIDDWEFINKIKSRRNRKEKDKDSQLKVYDESIMNIFQPWYDKSWIVEHINIESMLKFEIKYSTLNQQIIIPHRNIDGKLIGVRGRNMIDENVEDFGKYTPFMIGKNTYAHPLGKNLYGLDKNKDTIQRLGKLMLVESEKSVLQAETYFPNQNFTLAICGKSFSDHQRDLAVSLGVREIIIAVDKEYNKIGDDDYVKWCEYINEKFVKKLSQYVIVTVLQDSNGSLEYKDSPTDKGVDVLLQLMNDKVYV